MPIVLKHQAAGIAPGPNPNRKYGQSMVLQQQQADQNMRLRQQDAQYDMGRIGAMQQYRGMREPSLGEESMSLDQEIRSGLYEPDTVRALRDDERAIRMIMGDRNLDATQRSQALQNIQSRMRMMRATGQRMQPTIQGQSAVQNQPMALQKKPAMTEQEYFSDPKTYKESYAEAQARLEASGQPMTPGNVHAQMHNDYLERQRFLSGLSSPQAQRQPVYLEPPAQGQSQAPATQGAAPQATAPSPTATSAMPPGSYTGGVGYGGISPVLAQPARMNAPSGQSAYQPTGSYTSPEVYGASSVLANPAQPPMSAMEAVSGVKYDPNAVAPRDPTGLDSRKWTSADGQFSTSGKIVGVNPPTEDGGFSTVRIQKDDGKTVDVPMNKLSQQDQVFVLSKGNRDTMYALQNPNMTPGQAYFDPNNPVRQEISAADQSVVNPQTQTIGQPGGAYGLGGLNYGQGPSGQNVYADIVPGGTMPVPSARGATSGEQAYDEAAKKKYQDWRKKGRGSVIASPDQAPAADNALTKLLASMTPSQRRDYSKWLMEEPSRYAMRIEIAQQQLNQMNAAKSQGKLDKYPGMQARKQQGQQQGQAPVPPIPQEQPTQGQPPQAAPPATQGQSQPPKPAQQPSVKLRKDNKRVQEAMGIATNPLSTPQQLQDAASILAQSDFTEAEIAQMEEQRQKAIYENWRGGAFDKIKTPPPNEQKGRTAEVIDENVPPQQPAPLPATPAERAATAAGNVAGAVGRGASAVAQTPVGSFLKPIVTGASAVYDAITGGNKYSSETAKPSQKTPVTSPKAAASQPADGKDQTRAWTNENGVSMFDGKLESISEPITIDGTQTRVVTLRDRKGNVKMFEIGRFSQEDQNFLMTQYNIGIAKNAWPEKDFLGRYGTGEATKYNKKRSRPKKQSMNPKTSGYDENRRVPNPEYRQKGEKTPTAKQSQAKRTG